uniref:Restriction of telomere capping protein 4 n=1 Tax=Bionectria ochroleuca TaxID=29856 RepID=A0A8H7ND50_BIOOC
MAARRSGLSYADPIKPLLRVVRGKPRTTYHKRMTEDIDDSASPDSSHGSRSRPFKHGVSDPISDSESSVTRSHLRRPKDSDSDDTDEGRRDRAAISRTTFGSSKPAQRSNTSPKRGRQFASGGATEETRDQSQAKRKKLTDENGQASTSQKRKSMSSSQQSRASEPSSSAGSHLSESNGFTRRQNVTATYGASKKTSAKRTFKYSDMWKQASSQAKSKSLSTTFKPIPGSDDEFSSPKKASRFKMPKGLESSPGSQSPVAKFKSFDDDLRSPSPEAKAKFVLPTTLDPLDSEEKSPPPVFKFFPATQVADLGYHDESIATLMDTDSEDEAINADDKHSKPTEEMAVCPWCGDAVDAAFYREFTKGVRMNVQKQTRFCHKHKKKTALDTWRAKSYPSIDWDEMPSRVASHHAFLAGIVNGEPSYYRTKLAKKIESGASRAMKKEENLNPGYYGPKGFNIMCDLLVQRFTDLLKERAVCDRVISGRGSAAFIQCVLVAELAVQLIMRDLSVSAEEARTIMEDSKALGEMVQDE